MIFGTLEGKMWIVLTTLSKSHNDVRILQQIFGQVRSMKKMRHSIFLCIIWNVLSFMKVYHSDPQHAMSGAETPECRTPYQGAWGVTCDKGCLMCLASVATSRVTFKCLWNKIQNLAISMCFSELYWQLSTKTMLERWVQLSVCRSKVPPKPRRCRWPMLWRWGGLSHLSVYLIC